MDIRLLRPDDLPACTELNNAAIPAVSEASLVKMQTLVEQSLLSLVVEHEGDIVGFCVNFGPHADYHSVNYRWFCDRFDDFVYLDRIVVAPTARNMGIGASLYAAVQARIASTPWLFCEVNLRPRNDGSLRFHERLGFVEVGQQETDYGILVSMLAKDLRLRTLAVHDSPGQQTVLNEPTGFESAQHEPAPYESAQHEPAPYESAQHEPAREESVPNEPAPYESAQQERA